MRRRLGWQRREGLGAEDALVWHWSFGRGPGGVLVARGLSGLVPFWFYELWRVNRVEVQRGPSGRRCGSVLKAA